MTKYRRHDHDLDRTLYFIERHSTADLARRSGVSVSTIRNWRKGKTRTPYHITMRFVLQAAGYTFDIVKRK